MFDPITRLKKRLAEGQILIGSGIYFTDPQASEALADSFDFLWYDMEHSGMSLEALRNHLMVARTKNKPTIVRVTASGTPFIKPVLDAGASGIVVPQVRSVEEVRQVVSDCHYPPLGQRGFGPLIPTNYGRDDGGVDYAERANAGIYVSVMLETAEALEAIDEIVAVPGLDGVVIGPWDLSASLGLLGEVEHPTLVGAMEKIIETARAAGLSVGSGMPVDADFAAQQADRGVQLLQVGGDIVYAIKSADQIVNAIHTKLGT